MAPASPQNLGTAPRGSSSYTRPAPGAQTSRGRADPPDRLMGGIDPCPRQPGAGNSSPAPLHCLHLQQRMLLLLPAVGRRGRAVPARAEPTAGGGNVRASAGTRGRAVRAARVPTLPTPWPAQWPGGWAPPRETRWCAGCTGPFSAALGDLENVPVRQGPRCRQHRARRQGEIPAGVQQTADLGRGVLRKEFRAPTPSEQCRIKWPAPVLRASREGRSALGVADPLDLRSGQG